jgi:hypothetical protein
LKKILFLFVETIDASCIACRTVFLERQRRMSLVQVPRPSQEPISSKPFKRPYERFLILCLLLLLIVTANIILAVTAPPPDTSVTLFVTLWIISFLPYILSCIFVLKTKPGAGHWQWMELGIILMGALILRAMLLPIPPDLSHDSWRYLWDARVTLHGYSPYVYAPGDPLFAHLRDFIYDNSRFRSVPTLYPPGAQAIYLLSYLLAPSNLFFLKSMFMVFDLGTCAALAFFLLKYRGLDPCRAILYAWCPLPIVEFAIQGHVDAATITFMLLAVFCSLSNRRSARILTGFLIGMAALTKIYPILLLVVLVRRRDWALIATCFATILISYIPYLILGHGQVLGFFSTYANEHTPNEGIVKLVIAWLSPRIGLSATLTLVVEYLIDLLLACSVFLGILVLRLQDRISMEAAILVLIGTIFVVSSHIFPWYTTTLLPWVAVMAGPVWTRAGGLNGKGLAVAMAWYFACASIISYFFVRDWTLYYLFVYDVVLLGLGIAAIQQLRSIAAHDLARTSLATIYRHVKRK